MEFRDGDPKPETQPHPRETRAPENTEVDLPTLIERGRDIRTRSRDLLTRLLDLFRERPRT
jgi:hypothetical protein